MEPPPPCVGYSTVDEIESENDHNMSEDSIIIALPRVGKDGRTIYVYKFRTMIPGAQHLQSIVYATCGLDTCGKFRNDPRVTPLGKFLRKFWIDELPMIVNILKGDIRLFGVRPLSHHYFSLYDEDVKKRRIQYKPGLIPPYYADMPNGLQEIQQSELRYFNAWDNNPVGTDVRYVVRIIYNIVIKAVRSR